MPTPNPTTHRNLYSWLTEQVTTRTDFDQCWEWPFYRNPKGYGTVFNTSVRKPFQVHRVAFYLIHGRWPEPTGCHICDNPPCYNWAHLFEGSNADNTADMIKKGRAKHIRGSQVNTSKLSAKQVLNIRARYDGQNGVILAEEFGVSQSAISLIIRRKASSFAVKIGSIFE